MLNRNKFRPRLNRSIRKGDLVGVHWNSHTSEWSIVSFKSRRTSDKVVGYADQVVLSDVTFYVSKSGQRKVRNESVKNRHAFVVGRLESFDITEELPGTAYYNPYKVDTFVDKAEYLGGKVIELNHVDMAALTFDNESNRPTVRYR